MTLTELMQDWFEKIWNQGDVSFIDKYIAGNCEFTGLDAEIICCPADFHAFHKKLNAAFADLSVHVDEIFHVGDETAGSVAGAITVTGTHRGSGRKVFFPSLFIGAAHDGKLVKARNLVDYHGLMVQLGAVEADALEKALV